MALKIGALAERSRTNAPTIRYYEEIRLLPQASRRDSGQRSYGEEDVKRLTFIRRCREFAFPIKQVQELVTLLQDRNRSCIEAGDLARRHLASVRAKLAELKALERSLAGLVRDCDAICAGGPAADCAVLDDLTRPALASVSKRA